MTAGPAAPVAPVIRQVFTIAALSSSWHRYNAPAVSTHAVHAEVPIAPRHSTEEQALSFLTLCSVIVVPLFLDPRGDDSFRLPKEALLAALAILCGAVLVIGWLRRTIDFT